MRVAVVLSVVLGSTTVQAHNFSQVIRKVIPSVCKVEMTMGTGTVVIDGEGSRLESNPFDKFLEPPKKTTPQQSPQGFGSCFIVSVNNRKYVITNNHVANPNNEPAILTIVFYNDAKSYPANKVGTDKISDIAVLEMSSDAGKQKLYPIPALKWANSDQAMSGDQVFAIGHPMGQEWTVTQGIISATHKRSQNTWQEVIQTDVSINQGNSGGPLFTNKGTVVGVNTFIFAQQGGGSIGLNFSVSSNSAEYVVNELIANGKIRRGKIGVALGLDSEIGKVVIVKVEPGGPMSNAGFQEGDIIEKINNVDIIFPKDIGRSMDRVKPDQDVVIQVSRGYDIILKTIIADEYVFVD